MYDIVVIGAGPAGATFARLVAPRYKVLLVDKRSMIDDSKGSSSTKCCGGLLAPDAQAMLSKMGLGLPRSVLVEPQLFVVRAIDVQQNIERYYQRFYINMDRREFDRWLLSMIEHSVEVRLSCEFKSYEQDNGNLKVNLVDGKNSYFEKAKMLVAADGALSRVRKQALPGHPFPRAYIAIQHWVEADSQLPYFSTLFDPEITDYYCWTIPKEDRLIIGAALQPRRDVVGKFKRFRERLQNCGFRLGTTVHKEAAFLLRPLRAQQIATALNGIAFLGEAGGWISPSSAEGFSYAFRSALILADVLRGGLDGFEKRFHQKTRTMRTNLFFKKLKSQFIYDPSLRNIVMRSGLRSLRIYAS